MKKQYDISSVLQESRIFNPPKSFAKKAHISSAKLLKKVRSQAEKNPIAFWEQCADALQWEKKWKVAMLWNYPFVQWFVGGKLNASANCLDRHLATWRKNKAAIIWEGEPGEQRTLTYGQLHAEVCRAANILKMLGVRKGDTIAIYMGMVPEAVIAMLACVRIGAVHNVVFGGFSSDSLRDRIRDSHAKLLVTQDGAFRRGDIVNLKNAADAAVAECPSISSVLVVKRSGENIQMTAGRDFWWHELMKSASSVCKAEPLPAEHPLFILYTSGSTGKPKGILHSTGGYLTQVNFTTRIVFDLKDEDIYFCTADIGWVTGHSYTVYGPLSNGATVMMYEGAPNYPDPGRFWDIIERHRVTILYTAPTAIRSFMKWGDSYILKHDISSLRLLGSVGEPINPAAWMWYHAVVGKGICPIVDTWWQTETGAIMIAPIPGATPAKPGSGTLPLPGIIADVVRRDGASCEPNEGGFLVLKHPWPAMIRTVFGNDERYKATYWSEFPLDEHGNGGWYFTGDGARRDDDGYFWIIGRVDDVVNVSGHRLGTAEVESALVSYPLVAEAAVITRPDEIKGNALVAFVTLKLDAEQDSLSELRKTLKNHVAKEIGHIAKPDEIRFCEQLPKTRSGKIMRRLLREIVATGSVAGDMTTLEDYSVLEKLRIGDEE